MKIYTTRTDPSSLHTNGPNDEHMGHDDPKYIYNLQLLRTITVLLETKKIVRSLPKLKLEE